MSILEPLESRSAEERYERTPTLVFPSSQEPCSQLAAEVAKLIKEANKEGRPAVLGLATGSTPVPFYRELIRLHQEEGLSFENVISFNLDEYYGLDRDHPESYYRFMHDQLFDHIDIPEENVNIPDGTVPQDQLYEWCQGYEQKMAEVGGLDLQILGIGRTGHIGFNEPGSAEDSVTRMITLDRITRRDAASDFLGEANVPRFAITMGVGSILRAKRVVLMAWGENKAEVVRQAVEEAVTDSVSASYLQGHPNAKIVLDESAASQLTRYRCPWLVRSVTWDPRTRRKAVVWLSQKLGKPLLKLIDEDYNENGMSELLTEYGRAYTVNVDVFNQVQHTITGWPGGKPGADDTNRPERRDPAQKRVLVLSPEPQDAIVSMGGTLERLMEQGHELNLVCQTSGNLRVADAAAQTFAEVLSELAQELEKSWEEPRDYARKILGQMEKKGAFGADPTKVRLLKGLILRGEARDANQACGVMEKQLRFLDLPFYEKGRYRQFRMADADVKAMAEVLDEIKPHQIFATGQGADPSSLQAICFEALKQALKRFEKEAWLKDCWIWLYRGKEKPLTAYEIDMAVPMSPGQVETKDSAIHKFQAIRAEELESILQNRDVAKQYDALGMAEYEAIECFQRLE